MFRGVLLPCSFLLDPPKHDGVLRVVTLDIPEKERIKRNWLRFYLRVLDYKQLHKSVWLGDAPLPQELVEQLKVRGMLRYIHVVSVKEKGTLSTH